ncbi:MAG: M20/M25/M40 family metallo-hydrolase [Nitriliruptorales bacterium]|nr:M20/M25/M40 family metallo-hydrolase [Nitriliruptorales bacterium]
MPDLPSDARRPDGLDDISTAIADRADTTRSRLEELVRIPSISADGHDPAPVRDAAERTAALLEEVGLDEVRLLEIDGAHPYVYGEWLGAGDDAPTVLLYAHHDVQPIGTPEGWSSDPFEPVERDGRLYGRGAADDKAGVMVHVAAVEAWLAERGQLPLNVKVIIEGEEEIGSPHLSQFLDEYVDLLRADVIVLTDLPNWKVGWPALTYALRGMGELFVTVRTLEQPVHSGMWGGPIPDAFTATVKLLATLHDDHGRIAVAGFDEDVREPSDTEHERIDGLDADLDQLRDEARVLDGVDWVGGDEHSVLERIWMRPTITPTGIDAPTVKNASNTLLSEVRVKLSCRFAPGQDPDRALKVLAEHLEDNAPWGATVETRVGERNAAWVTDPDGPAFDAAFAAMGAAYGREPATIGCGGSIPFVQPFSDAFGGAPCLLTGIEDPHTNAHGDDESLHLEDFVKACLAEAYLFEELATRLG